MPLFEIASFVGGLIYVSKCVISINHLKLANITNIIFVRGSTTTYDRGDSMTSGFLGLPTPAGQGRFGFNGGTVLGY